MNENRRVAAGNLGREMLHRAMAARLPDAPHATYRSSADEGLGRQIALMMLCGGKVEGFNQLRMLRGIGQAIGETLLQHGDESDVDLTAVLLEEIDQGICEGLGRQWRERCLAPRGHG